MSVKIPSCFIQTEFISRKENFKLQRSVVSVKIPSCFIQAEFAIRLSLSERDHHTRKIMIGCNFCLSSLKLIYMLLQATLTDVKQVFVL